MTEKYTFEVGTYSDGLPYIAVRLDPFEDDEPLVCGLEDPDECEACT